MRSISSSGFTLIEMIIVIVILSIMSGFTIYFLVDSARLYSLTINQKVLFDEGRLALEKICRDLRDAQNISAPPAGSSASSLSFTRTHATAGDGVNENITIRLTGNTLEKVKTWPAAVIPLAENVSTFTVTREGASAEIKLILTLARTSGERVTLQTKVYPRNLPADSFFKNFMANWQER